MGCISTLSPSACMSSTSITSPAFTDEPGVNVERPANKGGVPEAAYVAQMAEAWRAFWDELRLSAEEFVRRTDLRHVRTVQGLFKLFRENGYVYKGHSAGQYRI